MTPRWAFADYLREYASWRRAKAHDVERDPANDRAIIALTLLARAAETGRDDELMTRVDQLDFYYNPTSDRFLPGGEAARLIASYGIGLDSTPQSLVHDLEEAVATDRKNSGFDG
jgi:hypothetical protein